MKRPRKGRRYTNRWGTEVVVAAHDWTPPSTAARAAEPAVSPFAAALADLAHTPDEPLSPPAVTVTHRFDLGTAVESKADRLDTEIGVVEFTEDLVLGFNDAPPPFTEADALAVIDAAADRYARLTAFIAAEQGARCDDLCGLPTECGLAYPTPHPRRVLEAIARRRGDGDPADLVVAALDGTADEDPVVLRTAAVAYATYMANPVLDVRRMETVETNIEAAVSILYPDVRDFQEQQYPIDPAEPVYTGGVPVADQILGFVDPATLHEVAGLHAGVPPRVDKRSGGVVFHLSDDKAIEIVSRSELGNDEPGTGQVRWTHGAIRRLNTAGGGRLVVATTPWGSRDVHDRILCAADFSRPPHIGWRPHQRVGFNGRPTSPHETA